MTTTDEPPAGPGPLDQPFPNMPPPPPPRPEPKAASARARLGTRRPAAKKAAAKAPAAPRARTRSAPGPVRVDYREGIEAAIESACIPLAMMAMRGDQLAAMNLATLDLHKKPMAKAADQLAHMHPWAEQVVALVANFGPMSGVASALLAPFIQMAVNAGMIPWEIGSRLGCVHPQQLLASLTTFEQHAAQAAAAAEPPPAPAPAGDPVI